METLKYRCPACLAEFDSGVSCPRCGFDGQNVAQPPFLSIGTLLRSRYRVGRVVHANSESAVYLAFDREETSPVYLQEYFLRKACKRGNGAALEIDEAHEELFLRGVKPFRNLYEQMKTSEASGILTVREVFSENETVYVVTDSGGSGTLQQLIQRKENPLSWNQAGRIFRPVLNGLVQLRAMDISHFGISPEVLHLFPDGTMRLGGFNTPVVRRTGQGVRPELYEGFAAPEQYDADQPLTEAADVYALSACILYAITGVLPEPSPRRLKDPSLMIPESIAENIPSFILAALADGLQPDPRERIPTVEQLRAVLYTDPPKAALTAASAVGKHSKTNEELNRTMPEKNKAEEKQNTRKHIHVPNFLSFTIAFVVTASILLHVCVNYIRHDPDYPYFDIGILGPGLASSDNASSELPPVSSNTSSDTSSDTTSSDQIPDGAIEVPDFTGKQYEEVLANKNFKILLADKEFSDKYDEGVVIEQNVTGYAQPGSAIAVTVSQGARERVLPDIIGDTLEEARTKLEKAGFRVAAISKERNDGYPDSTVLRISNSLKAGKKYDYGTAVDLVVSFRG